MLGVFFFPNMVTDFLNQKSQVSFDGSISSSRCRTSRWQSANGLCIHSVWKPEMFHDWSCFMCFRNPSFFVEQNVCVYINIRRYMYTYDIYRYISYIIPRYCTTFTKDFKHFYDWDLLKLSTNGLFVSFSTQAELGADAVWAQCKTYESVGLLSVWHLGVSKNRGTPKWMVYNGKPY